MVVLKWSLMWTWYTTTGYKLLIKCSKIKDIYILKSCSTSMGQNTIHTYHFTSCKPNVCASEPSEIILKHNANNLWGNLFKGNDKEITMASVLKMVVTACCSAVQFREKDGLNHNLLLLKFHFLHISNLTKKNVSATNYQPFPPDRKSMRLKNK